MIRGCIGQVRPSFGAMVGLDFAAVLALAEAQGALNPLLTEMLPVFEPIVLSAWRKEDPDDDAS